MEKLKILNRKQSKKILEMIEKNWGFKEKLDYVFLETEKGKIYLANREIFEIDISKLRVNSAGFYFAGTKSGIRLSIEGSQIIGPYAKKNVVELNDNEIKQWIRGEDIDKDVDSESFVIIKHNNDFFGSGKATTEGKILNYVPKIRRLR